MSEISKVEWQAELSVGYNNIDVQHKKLLAIMRDFADLLNMPQAEYKVKIGKVLTNLIDYTVYHFSAEEKILEKYEYPEFNEHKKIHETFIAKVSSALKQLASGDIQAGKDFYKFLGEWLVNHIAVTDHKWSEFIHKTYPDEEF